MIELVWKIFWRGILAVLFGFAFILLFYVIIGIGYAAVINLWKML